MNTTSTSTSTASAVAGYAHTISGGSGDYDALLDLVGERRFVLIGEASHGTHDFLWDRGEPPETFPSGF